MTVYVYSQIESEAATFQLGWRRVFGKQIGSIYLYPSEAKAFIAQWNPDFRFSCVLPAQERSILLNYKKKVKCSSKHQIFLPELILSQVIIRTTLHNDYPHCDCTRCEISHPNLCNCYKCPNPKVKLLSKFYLFKQQNAYDDLKSCQIPNIYPDGRICIGDQKIAKSLRQANANLWESEFNDDCRTLGDVLSHHHCPNAVHQRYGCSANHTYKSCRRSIKHLCQCPDKLKNFHLWNCLCGKGSCKCKCECPCCCIKPCQCICNCNCCRNICKCNCLCNLNYEFASAFTLQLNNSYNKYNSKTTLCGKEFISTTSRVEGVFISYDPGFLAVFPKNELTIDIQNKKPMIIGFARLGTKTDWELITKNGQIYPIFDREVCIL